MEKPEQIWFLLSRNLSGEATAQEKEALLEALRRQPALMQQYELLQRLWKPDKKTGTEEIEEKVSLILRRSAREAEMAEATQKTGTIPLYKRKWARWAAVLAGISLGAWLYTGTGGHKQPETNEIIAKKGSKTRTILPDGSTVWLNAGSSIHYDPQFAGNTREVTLQGEAYFDIVKQPGKPFIVHAGNINIKVLGTAFNVKSYAEEPTIETTLIRGLVQITRLTGREEQPIYLHPNQKIVLPKAEVPQTGIPKADQAAGATNHTGKENIVYLDTTLQENERVETAWVYNRLEFRGDTFTALAQKLERWYNITIHFEDNEVNKLVFNGSLENETMEQAFQALTTAVPFQFSIKGNEIYIRSVKN